MSTLKYIIIFILICFGCSHKGFKSTERVDLKPFLIKSWHIDYSPTPHNNEDNVDTINYIYEEGLLIDTKITSQSDNSGWGCKRTAYEYDTNDQVICEKCYRDLADSIERYSKYYYRNIKGHIDSISVEYLNHPVLNYKLYFTYDSKYRKKTQIKKNERDITDHEIWWDYNEEENLTRITFKSRHLKTKNNLIDSIFYNSDSTQMTQVFNIFNAEYLPIPKCQSCKVISHFGKEKKVVKEEYFVKGSSEPYESIEFEYFENGNISTKIITDEKIIFFNDIIENDRNGNRTKSETYKGDTLLYGNYRAYFYNDI